jgi:ribosome-associated protein
VSGEFLECGRVRIPLSELSYRFSRSGGPGGQNVNKVETRVEVRFTPAESSALTPEEVERISRKLAPRMTGEGEILVVADTTRHRERNRQEALDRLAALIEEALRVPKRRRKTRPTRASKERRLEEKRQRSETKRHRRPPKED